MDAKEKKIARLLRGKGKDVARMVSHAIIAQHGCVSGESIGKYRSIAFYLC